MVDVDCAHCGHHFTAKPEPKHRLMCGDSTKAEDVERVMDGERAALVFTDPPYNCGDRMSESLYASTNSPAMKELSTAEWDKGFDVRPFLERLGEVIAEDASIYVCTSHDVAPEVWGWMAREADFHGFVIWVKPNPMPSLMKRHWTWGAELIAYATVGKHVFNFPDEGHALSWWELSAADGERVHPTQKPVEVPARAIRHSSAPGAVVFDGFLGSGTTLIACEKLGRKCRALEVDQKYVDVAVARWEAFTGRRALLRRGDEPEREAFPSRAIPPENDVEAPF